MVKSNTKARKNYDASFKLQGDRPKLVKAGAFVQKLISKYSKNR